MCCHTMKNQRWRRRGTTDSLEGARLKFTSLSQIVTSDRPKILPPNHLSHLFCLISLSTFWLPTSSFYFMLQFYASISGTMTSISGGESNSLSHCSNEIIAHVVSYLDNVDAISFALTNHFLNDIASGFLIKEFIQRNVPALSTISTQACRTALPVDICSKRTSNVDATARTLDTKSLRVVLIRSAIPCYWLYCPDLRGK
jgi:hypothetical protein